MNDPLPYLEAMAAMASSGGMIPEQVWDSEPIPRRWLYPGCATGSAMPLAWAHAEFIKLLESRHRKPSGPAMAGGNHRQSAPSGGHMRRLRG